jgi:hypothetical protein
MSFDTFIGKSLIQSLAMGMGDPVTLNGNAYQAVLEVDDAGTERGARGGRRTVIRGVVTMKLSDWSASGAKEGSTITVPDGVARISSKPSLTLSVAKFNIEGTGA